MKKKISLIITKYSFISSVLNGYMYTFKDFSFYCQDRHTDSAFKICCFNSHNDVLQGPGLQSLFKVKVTLTLREVIMGHENLHWLSIFLNSFKVWSIQYTLNRFKSF